MKKFDMRVAKFQEVKGALTKRPAVAELVLGDPFWVAVTPFTEAKFGRCLENVQEWVRRNGGRIASVWDLTVNPDNLLEFEAHAIHCSEGGEYKDVTPCAQSFQVEKRLIIAARFEPIIPLPRNYLITLNKDNLQNRLTENYINAMHEIYSQHRQIGLFSVNLLDLKQSCRKYAKLDAEVLFQLVYSKLTGQF